MPSVPGRKKMAMMAAGKDIIMNEDDNSSAGLKITAGRSPVKMTG